MPLAPVTIHIATDADIEGCIALEQMLSEDNPGAHAHGFLLSGGDSHDRYREFAAYGAFYTAKVGDELAGFVFALPPGSPRMEQMRAGRARFDIEDSSVWELTDLAYLAKVGVNPCAMRQGIASSLYNRLFADNPSWHFMTTTVFSPLRNYASERLQERFGFRVIGSVALGDRGALKDVVCKVHLREAGTLRDQE